LVDVTDYSNCPVTDYSRQLCIELETATFKMSNHGTIAGVVWVHVGCTAVPGSGWSDCPVIILSWWIRATIAFAEAAASGAEWDFMNGPHMLCLRQAEGALWSVTWRERRLKGVQDHELGLVQPQQVLRELHKGAQVILAECGARGWHTPDIEALAGMLRLIRNRCPGRRLN
jgi:hypothetical protein